jgi:hypothetical protein
MNQIDQIQTVTINNIPLRITNYTIWSGGWEASVWLAITPAPGKVLGVRSMSFNDPGWTHFLRWEAPDERQKMQTVAEDYFKIQMNGNPYWRDNIILVMGWKNGGIPIALQRINITVDVEIPQSFREMADTLGLNRPFESAEPRRLELRRPLGA